MDKTPLKLFRVVSNILEGLPCRASDAAKSVPVSLLNKSIANKNKVLNFWPVSVFSMFSQLCEVVKESDCFIPEDGPLEKCDCQ